MPAICAKCMFGWYVTLEYLNKVHTANCDLYNAGSALVLDREMAGNFKEKKKKSERKGEKKQARAMAIRQAKARRPARANTN
nr:hypothetical protein CFP56_50169 [Quercus suber]